MKKKSGVHASRTIMYQELEKVMAFSESNIRYEELFINNITSKKSSDGANKTARYLKTLYVFETSYKPFVAFKYFWNITDHYERPVISILYALQQDDLLCESIEVMHRVQLGEKAAIELFEEVIEKYHPNQYSPNTRRSMAKNIASSWKQAAFIEGKVKNIRIEPNITYKIACFAFLLAYLNGDRGDFIWSSIGVKALCLPESKLRELALECARKDLMQYQHAGSVTAINFSNLLNKIGIHADKN